MGGTNPYIEKVEIERPRKGYKMTFKFMESNKTVEVDVDTARVPYSETGYPGSVLNSALGMGVEIEHACGGVCACSTCHVIVRSGLESCNEMTDDEADELEEAPGTELNSRLSCQCVPNGTADMVIEIPAWNKNAVKEGHELGGQRVPIGQ